MNRGNGVFDSFFKSIIRLYRIHHSVKQFHHRTTALHGTASDVICIYQQLFEDSVVRILSEQVIGGNAGGKDF